MTVVEFLRGGRTAIWLDMEKWYISNYQTSEPALKDKGAVTLKVRRQAYLSAGVDVVSEGELHLDLSDAVSLAGDRACLWALPTKVTRWTESRRAR